MKAISVVMPYFYAVLCGVCCKLMIDRPKGVFSFTGLELSLT